MNVEDTKKTYDAVLEASAEKIEELKDLIEQAGFEKKAKVLAKAADVKLGAIESIEYSWSDAQIYSEPMARTMKCMADASVENFSLNIEAADIDVTDTVTVVWELV